MLAGRRCCFIMLCATRGIRVKCSLNPRTATFFGDIGSVAFDHVASAAVLTIRRVPGVLRCFGDIGTDTEMQRSDPVSQVRSLERHEEAITDGSVLSAEPCLPSPSSKEGERVGRLFSSSSLQRQKDAIRAEGERQALSNPGFSFSAAGLLFPYHLGATQCLVERGYIGENTPLAGSSAGALVCAVIVSGIGLHGAMLATKELSRDCRANGTAFRLGAVLRESLNNFLPHDAHIKASGRIRVCITQVFRSPKGKLVDQFDSKADLIDALYASCFIPGFLAPRPVTMFRERICIDGGFAMFMPPTAADVTIRVCSFSASSLRFKNVDISPDCNPIGRVSQWQLLKWAMEPAGDEVLDNLFELGYQDASVWASKHDLSEFTKCITG